MMLEGVDNFRDFGVAAALPGRLFRAAHLANATPSDIAALKALDLFAIVDLRRPSERAQKPSPPGLAQCVIASDDGDREQAPHLEFLRQGDTRDDAVQAFLLDYYRRVPFEPHHRTLFGSAFQAAEQGRILIHCTAGKDRTGILAALILHHLGAAHTEIFADFLRTNDAMLREPHLGRAKVIARQLLGTEPSVNVLRAMLGVQAAHLEASLTAVRQRFSRIADYVGWVRAGLLEN